MTLNATRRQFVLTLCFGLCVSITPTFARQKVPPDIRTLIDAVSVTNLTDHITSLQYAGGYYSRVNFTPGNDSAVAYVRRAFDALPGLTSVEYDTFYIAQATPPLNSSPIVNITATIEGKKDPTKVYVVGAHMDCSADRVGASTWREQWRTIHAPGADDNATGVAAVIEIARILSDSALGFSSDYTLRFIVFGAEESGPGYPTAVSHPGSDHYAKAAKARSDNILGMVSIDMIGYNKFYDYLAIVSNSASVPLGRCLVTANDSNAIGLIMNSPPFTNATYSDHYSFWLQGYPAVCLIENAPPWNNGLYYKANPYYHTPADSIETVNVSLVKKVTQVALASIASLSNSLTDVGPAPDFANAPQEFTLFQNYPNPFNLSTIIKFQIPSTNLGFGISDLGFVSLKVYDLMGRDVATLVNGPLTRGSHTVQWDASDFTSGVYFYRLQAGGYSETKKLLLVK